MNENAGVIIGTEVEIAKSLMYRYPHKRIYQLADHAVCLQMKKTTLENLYSSLLNEEFEIDVPEDVRFKAVAALNKMLELS